MTERLMQWSMQGRLVMQSFSFEQRFEPHLKNAFVLAFLRDPAVTESLRVVPPRGPWTRVGPVHSVSVRPVPCSQLSMSFFDRLTSCGVARAGGHLVKRPEEMRGGFLIADELRKLLLAGGDGVEACEDDEVWQRYEEVYSAAERDEFLFRLFGHVCLGGELCQYEESLAPYLAATRHLYKRLVSVYKDPRSGQLHITSHVYKISAFDEQGRCVYPCTTPHPQTFSYLVVDPGRRILHLVHHSYGVNLH